MAKKKSSEVKTSIDILTNVVNATLFILGVLLIPMGTYLIMTIYAYLQTFGIILLVAGIFAMVIAVWGIMKHARMVKKMRAQAKADLNY